MELKEKVPEVRFKGFSGEWEETVLGELAAFTKGFGYSKNDLVKTGTPIVLYGRLYTNYQTVIENVDTYALAQKSSLYSNGSEVIVPASGETAEDIARASAILEKGVLLGGDLNVIYPESMLNAIFLALRISNGKPQKELAKKAQGKSVVHLRNNDLKDVSINYPSTAEQSRIGTWFQHLDQLITLHQKKYNKLTNIKKAMLEKMFPKNGADVPEIRFEGFEGKWEEKRLGEITNSYSGGTPSVGIIEYYNGNIPFIRSAEINSSSTELFLTEVGLNNSSAKIVHKGDVLYALYGATSGEVGRSKITGAINQAVLAIIPKNNENSEFIAQWLRKQKNDILGKYLQGGQGNLSGTIVKDLIIPIPCPNEQQKIGTYFQKLDHLITLQQAQIDKLKNIKKACLEKMFV